MIKLRIPAFGIIGIVGMIGVLATAIAIESANGAIYIANFPTLVIVFSFFFLMAGVGFMMR